MTNFKPDQLNGARSLIQDGLKLSSHHTLLLLYQRELTNAAKCIEEAANRLDVQVDAREFTREDFWNGYPEAFSPDKLTTSTVKPSGIVLLIEWSEKTTKARLKLVTDLQNEAQPWRVASMPGVDLDTLSFCSSDFSSIKEYSLAAFVIVARSILATLTTENPLGKKDVLNIPLEKKYCPIISTGEIDASSWGNIPSGETFVVPDEYAAQGWVTVRGSIPHRPLNPDEWIRFEVKRGRINHSSIKASTPELTRQFISLFFTPNGRNKCKNSNALAELGIGTNPGIKNLTGKPIFDEKKLGTVHIAFGTNIQFTGPLESCVHHDIVCTGVTLALRDNLQEHYLVRDGNFDVKQNNTPSKLEEFPEASLDKERRVILGNAAYQYDEIAMPMGNARLYIDYASARQQRISFTIAEGKTALLAKNILRLVDNQELTIEELSAKVSPPHDLLECRQVISGLLAYGLLK